MKRVHKAVVGTGFSVLAVAGALGMGACASDAVVDRGGEADAAETDVSVPDASVPVDAADARTPIPECSPDGWCYTDLPRDWTFDGGGAAPNPDGYQFSLTAVWVAPNHDAYAVSAQGHVLRWDGSRWSVVFVAPAGLRSVWGTASGDVWVAGDTGRLFHASGGSGALTFKPVTAGTSRSILQVWGTAPDDLWIVSEDFVGHATAETIGSAQPFAPVAVPSSYTDSVVFVKPTAVWGTANETWFAGTESSFCAPPDCVNETRTFVARRSVANDGAVSWSPLALPAYPGSLGIVAGVTVADGSQYVAINSDEVWTESWVAHVATDASLLDPDGGPIVNDGAFAWNAQFVHRFSRPTALWGTSSDDLWLLGASGVVRHFDGKEWQLVRVARTNLSPVAEDLRGIAATTDESGEREMWIVGDDIAMHRTVKP